MTTPTPTVNRMVHYRAFGTPGGEYPPACRAATITEVGAWMTVPAFTSEWEEEDGQRRRSLLQVWDPEACALHVANPTGQFFNTCRHDEGMSGGTWHWPEQVS